MQPESEPYGKSYYDGLFGRQSRNSPRNRNRLKLILAQRSGGRLLELGCGQGELLRLEAAHFEVEGIDISHHAIRTLRQESHLNVRRADIEQASLPSDAYDVVVAFNVLEHLRNPRPVIKKIQAALKTEGCLIGSVPYNAALLGRLHTALSNLVDRTHVSTYPPGVWRRLFVEAGFTQVDFFGEVLLGKDINRYIRRPRWPWVSFNLMFVCHK